MKRRRVVFGVSQRRSPGRARDRDIERGPQGGGPGGRYKVEAENGAYCTVVVDR